MLPNHPSTNKLDVRYQNLNIKTAPQNSYRPPRHDFSTSGVPECKIPWQGSLQGHGDQQLGGVQRGTDIYHGKFLQQQQQPQGVHWQFIEQQQSQEFGPSRQQNMQQVARAEFPQASYSALLHGPDTPPSQPEPAWVTPVTQMENTRAAENFRWPVKGVTGMHGPPIDSYRERLQGSSDGFREEPSGSHHSLPVQLRSKLNFPSRGGSELLYSSDMEGFTGTHFTTAAGSKVENKSDSGLIQRIGPSFQDQKWDGQNQSSFLPAEAMTSGRSALQQQRQHLKYGGHETRTGKYSQLQSQGSSLEQQESRVLPYGEMPRNSTPNGIDLQQYTCWNALQQPSTNKNHGSQLQHSADAGYNTWGVNAWQEGHFIEHTCCTPYTSGNMNVGPSHSQYGWQTQPAATVVDGFSQIYSEGAYSSENLCVRQEVYFAAGGEASAFPIPFESYVHNQGSQVYHPPANNFVASNGMPFNGAGWNEFSGPHDFLRQESQERQVHAGGQVQPQQLDCIRIKGSYGSQCANKAMDGAEKQMSLNDEDVELEGPQFKKQREFFEGNTGAYRMNTSQASGKLPPQPSSEDLNMAVQGSGGAERPQREFVPGIRFVPNTEQLREQPTNNHHFLGSALLKFREDNFSPGKNFSQTGFDRKYMSTPQDQMCVDPLIRRTGDQIQVDNSKSSKSSVHHSARASVGLENVCSEIAMSSYTPARALLDSQCTATNLSNTGEGPGSVFISSLRNQDLKKKQTGNCNQGHENSSSVDGGEHVVPYFHLAIQERQSVYAVNPFQWQARVQMPETNESTYLEAGPSETTAQFRGFGRSASGKFYPPPPFQSHLVHPQKENASLLEPCSEDHTLQKTWDPRIFQSAVLPSGMNNFSPKPVNYQASSGFLEEGMVYHLATDETVATSKSISLTEAEGTCHQGILSSEVENVSKQPPEYTLLGHTQYPGQIVAKNVVRGTHSRSMMVQLQGSARPLHGLSDHEQSRATLPSGYPGTMVSGTTMINLLQMDGDPHQPAGRCGDHSTAGVEYTALKDGESTISSKVEPRQISRNQSVASKLNLRPSSTLHPKKRKKPVSYLIPWHVVATQPRGPLPSISKAEQVWASAANRLPEKDIGEAQSIGIFRAQSRLRLTSQLMQQILFPLPSVLMHGNQPINFECGVYTLAKSALGEACRLMAGTERESGSARKGIDVKTIALHGQTRIWNLAKEVAMTKLVERFMDRIKRLEFELSRLDRSMSVLELKVKSHDLEKLAIVHRLGKHHGKEFYTDLSEGRLVEGNTNSGIRRPLPQKYVIAVPMPRTLPEGARCLSL